MEKLIPSPRLRSAVNCLITFFLTGFLLIASSAKLFAPAIGSDGGAGSGTVAISIPNPPFYNGSYCPSVSSSFNPLYGGSFLRPNGYGQSSGDPVDLATGQESFSSNPDLVVYNPNGPSVSLQRTWNQYAAFYGGNTCGFGWGWSLNYDVTLRGLTGTPGGATPSAISMFYPNGSAELIAYQANGLGAYPPVYNHNPLYKVSYGSTGDTILVTWRDSEVVWVFNQLGAYSQNGSYYYRLVQVTNRTGQSIYIDWDSTNYPYPSSPPLDIRDDYGNFLVTFTTTYQAGATYGDLSIHATDCYGRSFTAGPNGVSQINSSDSREHYTYTNWVDPNNSYLTHPFLTSIQKPGSMIAWVGGVLINYNPNATVQSSRDSENNITYFSYSVPLGSNHPAHTTIVDRQDGAGHEVASWSSSFDSYERNTSNTDGFGTTSISYDSVSTSHPYTITNITYPDGLSESASYTTDGLISSSVDELGLTTSYTWVTGSGGFPRLATVQGPLLTTRGSYSEPSGLPTLVIVTNNANGGANPTITYAQNSYIYDSYGDVTSVTTMGNESSASMTVQANYSAVGRPNSITDSMGRTTLFAYGGMDAYGAGADYSGCKPTEIFDPNWNVSEFSYDLYTGRIIKATSPTQNVTQYSYTYRGGPLDTVSLPNASQQLNATYGSEGELRGVSGNTTEAATYAYDAAYRLVRVTDAANNQTNYNYDTRGALLSVVKPGGDTMSYGAYDSMGRVGTRTDGNGIVTTYGYSPVTGALSSVQYSSDSTLNVSLGFDAYGRVNHVLDGSGTEDYTYDDASRLTGVNTRYNGTPWPSVVGYQYNGDGSLQLMTSAIGNFHYYYDASGRYTQLDCPAGSVKATNYANGWAHTRTLPNNVVTTYAYNGDGTLSDQQTSFQGGTDHFTAFNYDSAYNLTSLSSSVFGSTANGAVGYSYDSNNRLTGEAGQGISNSFAYSAASNATTFRGASFGFNQKNQLTATAFAYDGNGNPTTYKGQALTFDPENRMTSYGSLMTAGYRSDGLRAWKQANGTKTYYYYGGGQLLFEGSNGYITARNIFGPDGLVARTGSGGTWVCYTFDQQGNVTHRTDPSGNVLGNYGSDAYGNPTSWANSTAPYDYNGQWGYYKDVETGLYYCQNRYYDPVNGRWLTQDPIGMDGGINLYGYCGSSPLGSSDEEGLDWLEYQGQNLSWYRGQYGNRENLAFRVQATSGGPDYQSPDFQGKAGSNTDGDFGGPVPEGQFEINLALDPNRLANFETGYAGHLDGISRIPTDKGGGSVCPAWGTWRAFLKRKAGKSYGRDGHYIHDSGKGYTHGCIETNYKGGQRLLKALLWYRRSHKRIFLHVGYTTSSTNGGTTSP